MVKNIMSEKSYVGMEYALCPALGKTHPTGSILLDSRLLNTLKKETVTHYELHPEVIEKNKEGFICLVAIDSKKSGPTNKKGNILPSDVYRTGQVLYVKREVFFKYYLKETEVPDTPFVFIDEQIAEQLIKCQEKE